MLEAKLWHNETEPKNIKVAKMVKFIKSSDQYPHNFKNTEKTDLQKTLFGKNG